MLLPGAGHSHAHLPPHPAPQAEKVSQICRNRRGGRQRHCHRSDVTPAHPTGAAITTPGPRSCRLFAINSCEKGGIMQKYFLPHLHPVPTVPERPRAGHTEPQPLPSSPPVSLGVPPGLRGLRQGGRGEPGRFLSSGVDSCRASCGFPLLSPPAAVTPSTHTPVPKGEPTPLPPTGSWRGAPRELLGSSAPTLHPFFATHPTPTLHQSLHPKCPPCAPLNTTHTPVTLCPPSASCTPCAAPVPWTGLTQSPHHGTFPTPQQCLEEGGHSTRG